MSSALEEIIVTGQGSGIERRKLSTTVDVLLKKDIDKLPATQIDQLLQASTPSAQIRLSSGQPGTASIIRTRGPISAATSSTPIIIVNGIRVDNLNSNPDRGIATGGADVSALADIPIESIEKVEYIKGGAATTLYGADAANGVIQIITKKGTPGANNIFFETRIGGITGTDDYLKYTRTAEAIFEPGLLQEYKNRFIERFFLFLLLHQYLHQGFCRGLPDKLNGIPWGFISNFISHPYSFMTIEQPSFRHRLGGIAGFFVYLVVGNTTLQGFEPLIEEIRKRGSLTFFVSIKNIIPSRMKIKP